MEKKASAKSRVKVKCPKCENIFLPSKKETQSRAGAAARRKGANFENRLAKKFAKWWPGKHEFKRTPMSGGSALKEGWDLSGDIATTASDFPWHLELKNAPSQFAGLHQFFTSEKFALWKWLQQATEDCPRHKIPMVIFNRYDQPTYCAVDARYDSYVSTRLQTTACDYIELNITNKDTDCALMHMIEKRVCVWTLDSMLNSDPEMWK